MELFWNKKSKAAIEREQKEKADRDRARTQQIKLELLEVQSIPFHTDLPMEELNQYDSLIRQAALEADRLPAVSFEVENIDKEILGIIEILRHAKENSGSRETIKRCLTGIAYGLRHGHREIPSHANEDDVVERRVNQLKRYREIVKMSEEIDKNYAEISRRTTEKRNREGDLQESRAQLKKLKEESPSVFYKVMEMTPNERTTLTGEDYNMAAAISSVVNRTKEINHLDLLIGNSRSDIETLQSSVNNLVVQLENWERNIDEATIAEIQRLTKDFERQRLEQQQYMKKLNDTSAELDSAFNALYNTLETKETVVAITEEYDEIMRNEEKKIVADAAGRERLNNEKMALQKELENVQENAPQNQENRTILYN